ncbi:CPBP family intramembrane glutamic endopeptidase, partial [Halobacterium bonnevillei]
TPASTRGWLLLFGVSLPVVAGFEELLFRGFLVGAFATGFEVSPWLLAVASSVVFGAGHTAQGYVGVVVTTLLGFALAAAYVVTGSLLVVVVAHYVVNAAEFALHARG